MENSHADGSSRDFLRLYQDIVNVEGGRGNILLTLETIA
jgi:hypothetical protein